MMTTATTSTKKRPQNAPLPGATTRPNVFSRADPRRDQQSSKAVIEQTVAASHDAPQRC